MSLTLALITLSSYSNWNTVVETRWTTEIFIRWMFQLRLVPIWGRPSLCSCQTWVPTGLQNAWPPASGAPPVRTRCGSQSWTCDLISERDIDGSLSAKAKFHGELPGSIRVSSVPWIRWACRACAAVSSVSGGERHSWAVWASLWGKPSWSCARPAGCGPD